MSDTTSSPAVAFEVMAARIRDNAAHPFGGAFVIVAPDGTSQDLLLLDSRQAAAQFWALLQSRVQIAIAENDNASRGNGWR